MYRIDKTETLAEKLNQYPSIYIEAAAAAGKTTAVEMLKDKYPTVTTHTYYMDDVKVQEDIEGILETLMASWATDAHWVVFENLPSKLPEKTEQAMVKLVRTMPKNWNVIFISREQPSVRLLDLLWKSQMEIISQKELALTLKEVQKLAHQQGSLLPAKELYRITGGWAGCVAIMIRMAKSLRDHKNHENEKLSLKTLRDKHEINNYINHEILATLSKREQEIVRKSMTCPWFNESICREIWKMKDAGSILEGLERKGILTELPQRGHWQLTPLFNLYFAQEFPWKQKADTDIQEIAAEYVPALAQWYENQGYLREALWCIDCFESKQQYIAMLLRHYDTVPYMGVSYEEVFYCNDDSPQLHYLRGMHHLKNGDWDKLSAEIKAVGKENPELYLNLTFVSPNVALDDWMRDAEKLIKKRERNDESEKFRIYELLGQGHTCLCGVRDLTGLFACSKKEENKHQALWKRAFDEDTYQAYCLARLDYYIETDREKNLYTEDSILLSQITNPTYLQQGGIRQWKKGLAGLYLLCRLQAIHAEEERKWQILQLKETLDATGDVGCINNAEAILGLYAQILGNPEQSSRWLMAVENKTESELTYTERYCQIKGYLLLQQYEKTENLLQKMILNLKEYHMHYHYAEVLFQQAIVNWQKDLHGQALKNAIESFLIAGTGRYVGFYTSYGKSGVEIIKNYVEWMQNNASSGWNTKKKYNYGHVLRMPIEDYLEFILRKAKRNVPKEKAQKEPVIEERLTMMETVVLQDISRGLTNADICEAQNLKLSTVKTHIYSIYKKLGVKTRVQATLKGREMGIIK